MQEPRDIYPGFGLDQVKSKGKGKGIRVVHVQAPELTCVLVMLSAARERSNQPTKRQKMLRFIMWGATLAI